jgi:cytidine deaminase
MPTMEGIDPELQDLFDAAHAALERAHAPYSHYRVGAAIRAPSGAIHAGCNVENASYPEGTCAETGAIAAMVLAGERAIVEIVTVTEGAVPGTPCGGCRQRIREFARPDTMIHSTTTAGVGVTATMSSLLPNSFGPENLLPDD